MFVVMAQDASEAEILGVKSQILAEGLTPFDHAGRRARRHRGRRRDRRRAGRTCIDRFAALPGVETVTPISRPFKLTSREFHPEDTVIRVLDAVIGDGSLTMMAGPCSVESRDQLFETADAVAAAGATILRGGAFKPRTSPYAFQGLGVEALRYLAEARDRTGLPVITEVMEPNQVDIVAEYADILQIGTRNMQNYSLLRDVGRVARPVMLKRGYGATVEEWLMAAEYIVSSGNPNVILCERGIRTFETYTRNTLDLAAVPLLHHLTHLPVIVDPSHATGKRWLVMPLAIGGVAVGADGVMVEVHPDPDAGAVRRRAAARPRGSGFNTIPSPPPNGRSSTILCLSIAYSRMSWTLISTIRAAFARRIIPKSKIESKYSGKYRKYVNFHLKTPIILPADLYVSASFDVDLGADRRGKRYQIFFAFPATTSNLGGPVRITSVADCRSSCRLDRVDLTSGEFPVVKLAPRFRARPPRSRRRKLGVPAASSAVSTDRSLRTSARPALDWNQCFSIFKSSRSRQAGLAVTLSRPSKRSGKSVGMSATNSPLRPLGLTTLATATRSFLCNSADSAKSVH